MANSFGKILRDWRRQRHLSQLNLSLLADVSARHVSFLESSKAKPSREMILKLAEVLQVSKAQINEAFLRAEFAPIFQNHPSDHVDLRQINTAITTMLDNHLPYPAIVVDSHWNIKQANSSAVWLLSRADFTGESNLIEALLNDDPHHSSIENWQEAVTLFVQRLKVELFQVGNDAVLNNLIKRLEAHLHRHFPKPFTHDLSQPVIPTRFLLDEGLVSLFSTFAQFGTVFDLSVSDLRIELMFPSDDHSATVFKDMRQA